MLCKCSGNVLIGFKLFSVKETQHKYLSFKVNSRTFGTGWYNNGLALEVATNKSWISADSQGRRRQTRNIPRRTGQWSLNLGMGPGR